jgi:hypothetical protein
LVDLPDNIGTGGTNGLESSLDLGLWQHFLANVANVVFTFLRYVVFHHVVAKPKLIALPIKVKVKRRRTKISKRTS